MMFGVSLAIVILQYGRLIILIDRHTCSMTLVLVGHGDRNFARRHSIACRYFADDLLDVLNSVFRKDKARAEVAVLGVSLDNILLAFLLLVTRTWLDLNFC